MTFWQIVLLLLVMGWCTNVGFYVGKPVAADRLRGWKAGLNLLLALGGLAALLVWLA